MLSAAGLSEGFFATGKSKTLGFVPPLTCVQKISTPLPPPPNDPAVVRMTSGSHVVTLKGPKENTRHSTDPFTDLSQLEDGICGEVQTMSLINHPNLLRVHWCSG